MRSWISRTYANLRAFVLAILVHIFLFSLMLLNLDWNKEIKPAAMAPIQAVAIIEPVIIEKPPEPVIAPEPKPEPEPEPEPIPEPPKPKPKLVKKEFPYTCKGETVLIEDEQEAKVRQDECDALALKKKQQEALKKKALAEQKKKQAELEKKKLAEEKRKQEQEKKVLAEEKKKAVELEKKKLAEQKRKQQQKKKALAEEKKKQAEIKKKKVAEQKRKQEQQKKKALAEKKKKAAELEKKKLAEQKRKQQQKEKALAEKKKREAKARQAVADAKRRKAEAELVAKIEGERVAGEAATALGLAVGRIAAAVDSNWIQPQSATFGLKALIEVNVGRGGVVLSARVVESSGSPFFDRSAELAVRKASPLPIPTDPRYYQHIKIFRFNFDPNG